MRTPAADGRAETTFAALEAGSVDRRNPSPVRPVVLAIPPIASYADRFGYLPVTAGLAAQARFPAAAIAASVTVYLVAYGISQPFWGILSDRFGRRIVLIGGLLGLALADTAVVLEPGPAALVGLRAVAGAASGALLPTSLAAVADLVAPAAQHRLVSRLVSGASVGGAAAMLAGGVTAARFGWRVPMGGLAVAALAAAALVATRQLAGYPGRVATASSQGKPAARSALRPVRGAASRLYGFALMEGIVILGAFPLIVPALRASGQTAAGAGTAMAAYGLAAVAGSALISRLAHRDPGRPVRAGGLLLVLGLLTATAVPLLPLAAAAVASTCLGAAFSLFHSRFQVLATQLAPQARGLGIGLFAGMVFTGAAIGTAAGASLAHAAGFPLTFGAFGALAVPIVLSGYRISQRPPTADPHAEFRRER